MRAGLYKKEKALIRLRSGLVYPISTKTDQIIILNEIWSNKIYDRLASFIRDNSTVIDIGANIGVFSAKAANSAKNVRVYSYEPFPNNFQSLKESARLNNLEKSIISHKSAVLGRRGELELFFSPDDSGNVSGRRQEQKGHSQSIKVAAVTLEDVFKENNIDTCDFMKIDCEGAEEEILMNVPKEILKRIRSITLEWHYNLNKMTIDEFRRFLESAGYETEYIASTLMLYAWRD